MKLLLDTTVLIDVLRKRRQRRELLAETVRAGHTLVTTALNIGELYSGLLPNEESAAKALLENIESFDITRDVARLAGSLRNAWAKKGRTLTLADMVVAAAAIEHGCALATDNREDFPMTEVRLYPLP
jgi:predicted nucleic acid-binding protein